MNSRYTRWIRILIAMALSISCAVVAAAPARGPPRIHPDNPRYFTDGTRNPDESSRSNI